MHDVFTLILENVFTNMDDIIVKEKQTKGWTVEKNVEREIQFTFSVVRFTHKLMHGLEGNAHYGFDEWVGLKKYQRRSSC